MKNALPEPSSILILGVGLVTLLFISIFINRQRSKSTDELVAKLELAEDAVSEAYGSLPLLEKLLLLISRFFPYMIILFFVEISQSFSVMSLILQGKLWVENLYGATPAFAQDVKVPTPTLLDIRNIFSLVFLLMFVISFFVTLRDEFFSDKPRPISKDLNRAFIGFIIGQLTKVGL